MSPVLEARSLVKHFPVRSGLLQRTTGHVHAVDNVSFSIARGETLCLVGESGCGKSTVGRLVMQLIRPDAGEILFGGKRVDTMGPHELRMMRRHFQFVFQDPFSSLSPRMKVRDIIAEPLVNFGIAQGSAVDDRVAELLDKVRLPRDAMRRLPHEFSGGQRQRIGIARALAPGPELIVCDEAVSALDVSVKAQIVNLLSDLQEEFGLAMLFISHDLAVVEHIATRVAVMYLGKLVEIADCATLFARPKHPYTQALLSAVPVPDPERDRDEIALSGEVPSPIHPPSGCRFHTRCPYVFDRCPREEPLLTPRRESGHLAACHLGEAVPPLAVAGREPAALGQG